MKRYYKFITLFYNHKIAVMPAKDLNDFKTKINYVNAMSTTNFVSVFDKILKICEKVEPVDLTVLFFTDGMDTCNRSHEVKNKLDVLKQHLDFNNIQSRFCTIALGKDHDPLLLNSISNIGSDLGNFNYINVEKGHFEE